MASTPCVKLAYKVFHPAGGDEDETLAPLLFLHGITSSNDYWDDIPQIMADRTKRKAYAIDARNHGDSEWSDEFSFDANAEDLLRFMDNMAIHKAIPVGHSMGGITAIRAALKKPEKFEMLFIEDIGIRKPSREGLEKLVAAMGLTEKAVSLIPTEYDEQQAFKFIVDFMKSNIPESQQTSTMTANTFRIPIKRDGDGRYCLKANMKVLLRAMIAILPPSSDKPTNTSDFVGSYTGPACFIYGTESYVKLKDQEELVTKLFPRAELVPIEGADHLVHTSFPTEFTEVVLERLLKL